MPSHMKVKINILLQLKNNNKKIRKIEEKIISISINIPYDITISDLIRLSVGSLNKEIKRNDLKIQLIDNKKNNHVYYRLSTKKEIIKSRDECSKTSKVFDYIGEEFYLIYEDIDLIKSKKCCEDFCIIM